MNPRGVKRHFINKRIHAANRHYNFVDDDIDGIINVNLLKFRVDNRAIELKRLIETLRRVRRERK